MGVVALAFPRWYQGGRDPDYQPVPQQSEVLPRREGDKVRATDRGMIHFDIDLQNAMVGGYGDFGEGHVFTPIVKVSMVPQRCPA